MTKIKINTYNLISNQNLDLCQEKLNTMTKEREKMEKEKFIKEEVITWQN